MTPTIKLITPVLALLALSLTSSILYTSLYLSSYSALLFSLYLALACCTILSYVTFIDFLRNKKGILPSASKPEAEQEFSYYSKEIIGNLDVGMAIADEDGRLLSCNPLALNLFNTNGELNEFPKTLNQALNTKWKAKSSDGYQMACFSNKSQQRCVLEYMTKIISENSSNKRYLIIVRDVTQRISVNAELANYRLKLEDLVVQRSHALAQARDRAIEAHQEKNTFLANMTHELRTPLNAVIGYCELLDAETKDNSHYNYNDDIQKIYTSAQALKRLVNNVLEIQESEKTVPQLNIDKINLQPLLQEIAASCDSLMQSNNNTLTIEIEAGLTEFEGDREKVKKILFNLLENSTKYTNNGQISISAKHRMQHGHDYIYIAIKDQGIGIDAEHTTKIFEKFKQVDSSTRRNYDGAGLGLALCKRLALIMGGDVSLSSTPNIGSTFTLSLPANAIKSEIDPASIRFTDDKPNNKPNNNEKRDEFNAS